MSHVRVQAIIRDEAGNKLGGTGYEVRFYQAATNTLTSVYPDAVGAAIATANPVNPNGGGSAALTVQGNPADTTITVNNAALFALANFITIDNGTTRLERVAIAINVGTGVITLNAALGGTYTIAATKVNGRENLGYVAAYLDNGTDIEMTVKTLATGIEGPRELFLIAPVSDMIKLGDQDLNALASFTIPASIPSTYSKLILEVIAKDNSATNGNDLLNIQFGTGGGAVDTAANYYYEQQVVRGVANVAPGEGLGQTVLQVGLCAGGGLADGNLFSTNTIELVNYKETTGYKTARSKVEAPTGVLTTTIAFYDLGGYWKNTNGITSVKIAPSAGTAFAGGSRLRWYGVK